MLTSFTADFSLNTSNVNVETESERCIDFTCQRPSHVSFLSVLQEIQKHVDGIGTHKFTLNSSENSLFGKMEIPGTIISHIKLKISIASTPSTTNKSSDITYVIKAERVLGDIPAFYSFLRVFAGKFGTCSVPNDVECDLFSHEEAEDLNDELIRQCALNDIAVVRRMLTLPLVDITRYDKNGHTALHTVCYFGNQQLYTLFMETTGDKIDLYLPHKQTGRTPMETALSNQQMDFIEFIHETYNVPLPQGFFAIRRPPPLQQIESHPTYETAASRASTAAGYVNNSTDNVTLKPPTRAEKDAKFEQLSGKKAISVEFSHFSRYNTNSNNVTLTNSSSSDSNVSALLSTPIETNKRSHISDYSTNSGDNSSTSSNNNYSSSNNGPSTASKRITTESNNDSIIFHHSGDVNSSNNNSSCNSSNDDAVVEMIVSATTTAVAIASNIVTTNVPVSLNVALSAVTDDNINNNTSTFSQQLHQYVHNHSGILQKNITIMLHLIRTYIQYYASLAPSMVINTDLTTQCIDVVNNIIATEKNNNNISNYNEKQTALNTCNENGTCLIHLAAGMNDIQLLQTQISSTKIDLNISNSNNQTPLHIAVQFGHYETVQLLLHSGLCNIHAVDSDSQTALHLSAQYGHVKIMQLLTEYGASHLCHTKHRGSLHWAAYFGQYEICVELIKLGCDIDAIDENGDTALIVAAKQGSFGNFGSFSDNLYNSSSRSEYYDKYSSGLTGSDDRVLTETQQSYFNVLNLLLSHNARVDVYNHGSVDSFGNPYKPRTILHYIDSNGYNYVKQRVAQTLTRRLFGAVSSNNIEEITLLLNMGVSVHWTIDRSDNTVLHIACQQSSDEVVTLLLRTWANPNTQNYLGITPLMYAVKRGWVSIVQLLLQAEPDVLLSDSRGRTAMHYAAAGDNLDILKLLLLPNYDVVDGDCNVSHSAPLVDCDDSRSVVSGQKPRFLPNLQNVNVCTTLGSNLLSVAIAYDHIRCVDFLFSCGARAKQCDILGRTAEAFIVLKVKSADQTQQLTASSNSAATESSNTSLPTAVQTTTSVASYHDKLVNFMHNKGMNFNNATFNTTNSTNTTNNIVDNNNTSDSITNRTSEAVTVDSNITVMDVDVAPAETKNPQPIVLVPDPAVLKILKRDAHQQLYHACIHNALDRVKYLVDTLSSNSKFNINQKVEDRQLTDFYAGGTLVSNVVYETALYGAVIRGHTAIVRYLLSQNANVTLLSRNGWSPLFAASKRGFVNMVELLLQAPGIDVNCVNKNQMTPLNMAAYCKQIDICRILLQAGANPNLGDKLLARPLHASIQMFSMPIVKLLLDYNADVNVATNKGISPLYVAAFNGNIEALTLLLEKGAEINAVNSDGLSPLLVSAYNGHTDCCKLLLSYYADITISEVNGVTAFYAAVQNNHIDVVKLLLTAGVDMNHQINNGNAAIHSACIDGKIEILSLLLEFGADFDISNVDLATPLYMAAEKGQIIAVNILLETGKVNINVQNKYGVTPLNIASQNGHLAVVQRLITAGADVNIQSYLGPSALFISAQNGHTDIVTALLAQGAKLDCATKDGETAIFVSSYFGFLSITEQLIAAGAELNTPDNDGRTPMWWAAKNNKVDIVKTLIKARADVNISDREDKTPMQIAALMKHDEVCELIAKANNPPSQCSVCLCNPRNIVFLPCKHLLCCFDCNRKLVKSNSTACPLCREEVTERITVYNV